MLLTNAVLAVRALRRVAPDLPVEIWHNGAAEMPDGMRALLLSLRHVDVRDLAEELRRRVVDAPGPGAGLRRFFFFWEPTIPPTTNKRAGERKSQGAQERNGFGEVQHQNRRARVQDWH